MRKLLLLALTGMALSKLYFGTFVPPELKLKAPGFDLMKDGAYARKARWFTHPAHLHPAWMQGHEEADAHARPQAGTAAEPGASSRGVDAAAP
jgi:hypothetical protein